MPVTGFPSPLNALSQRFSPTCMRAVLSAGGAVF